MDPERTSRRWALVRPARTLAVVVSLAVALAVGFALGGPGTGPPDGTRTSTSVPDELPAGAVLEGARDVEATVATLGDSLSVVVTYVVDLPSAEVAAAVERALAADGWRPRSSSSDGVTSQAVLDGPDEAVLTVTSRSDGTSTLVAAALARG